MRSYEPSLSHWLASQIPPVPGPFLARLLERGDPEPSGDLSERLVASLRDALQDALEGEGERRGAFRLLAADAWITWACELALRAPDPESELVRVLDQILVSAGAP